MKNVRKPGDYLKIKAWDFGRSMGCRIIRLLYIIFNIVFIPFEERKMESTFDKDYLDYKKKVERWF
jgi:protein-S-isoprenylcysteine O-methyltransferase Ste14